MVALSGGATSAVARVGLAYCIWQTVQTWGRLIMPFMVWDLEPQPSFVQIGIITSLGNLFNLIGTVVFGTLHDSMGRRFVSLVATVITLLYIIIASQVKALWLMFCIQLLRIGSIYPQVAEATVGGLYAGDEKQRIRALIWLTIPYGFAMVLGPWLAGAAFRLIEYDLRYSYAASAGLLILGMLPTVLFIVPEPRNFGKQSYSEGAYDLYVRLMKNARLRRSIIFRLLLDIPFAAFDEIARAYFVHFLIDSPTDMSTIAAVIGLTTLIANSFVVRPLQQKFSAQRVLQLSYAVLIIAYFLLSFSREYWSLLLAMPIQMIGYQIGSATISAQVIGSVDSADIGKAVGLMQSAQMLGTVIMPIISAIFMGSLGYPMVCYSCAAASTAGVAIAHLLGSYMRQQSSDFLPGI